MARGKKTFDEAVHISPLQRGTVTAYLLGTSPLMMNRMANKAQQELLLPRRSLNKAARQMTLKHNPPEEYRNSAYRCRDDGAPTFLHFPENAFKKAMAQAAIDLEGATKAEVGRLITILDTTVHVYGKPYLDMRPVKLAGMVKTPDMRTRAILPQWCCKITVQYMRNKIREQDIGNLLDAAGAIVGIGDGRTEKGTYNYGSWRVVSENDKEWHAIVKQQARKVQEAAWNKPEAVDADTEELLAWYYAEIIRRERDDVAPPQGFVADEPKGRRRREPALRRAAPGWSKRPNGRAQAEA